MKIKLITMQEAAAMLGCTWQTVRYYIKIGRLKGVQVNAVPTESCPRWAVYEAEVNGLAAAHRHSTMLKDTGYYTYSQAAAILECSRSALEGAIARGWLKPVKLSVLCLEREAVEALYMRCAELITIKDAAAIIGVSDTMVDNYIKMGQLTLYPYPLGKQQRLIRADVQAFANQRNAEKQLVAARKRRKRNNRNQ